MKVCVLLRITETKGQLYITAGNTRLVPISIFLEKHRSSLYYFFILSLDFNISKGNIYIIKTYYQTMYQKPEVRVIECQQETSQPTEVTQSEANALLAKYGFAQPQFQSPEQPKNSNADLTFEELIRQEEMKKLSQRKPQTPNPYSFDRNRVAYHNSEYRDLGIDGHNVGVQVQIVTDMKMY